MGRLGPYHSPALIPSIRLTHWLDSAVRGDHTSRNDPAAAPPPNPGQTMTYDDTPSVRFDRATDRLETVNGRARLGVALMRLCERLTRPFGHLGISRLHSAVGQVFAPGAVTEIGLAGGGTFAYPAADYYWNRMLTRSWDYEEDIQAILKALAPIRYTLIDVGANFGFFSCLAASPAFGSQRIVAVEPSRFAFSFLERNLRAHGDHAELLRLAIDETSGNTVTLYGERHAGFSLSSEWFGASQAGGDEVLTISIDDLMERCGINTAQAPALIKLEVEGIEMRALRGAAHAIDGDVAIILEEVDPKGLSEATRFVFDDWKLEMFYADGLRFRQVTSLADFEAYRRTQQGLQARGTSIIAFRDPRWRERLASLL